jgi:hypothetical protein
VRERRGRGWSLDKPRGRYIGRAVVLRGNTAVEMGRKLGGVKVASDEMRGKARSAGRNALVVPWRAHTVMRARASLLDIRWTRHLAFGNILKRLLLAHTKRSKRLSDAPSHAAEQ